MNRFSNTHLCLSFVNLKFCRIVNKMNTDIQGIVGQKKIVNLDYT